MGIFSWASSVLQSIVGSSNPPTMTSQSGHGMPMQQFSHGQGQASSTVVGGQNTAAPQQSYTNTNTMTPEQIQALKTDRPWMFVGYPLFTKWMASSEEGVVLRRFDELHARVLLKMQDNIVAKEERLHELDQKYMAPNENVAYNNGSFRYDEDKHYVTGPDNELYERTKILEDLELRIRNYDQMILNYRKLRSDPDPPKKVIENVRAYFRIRGYTKEGGHGPIDAKECDYINHTRDLLVLVPKEKQPLRRLLERFNWIMHGWWFREGPSAADKYEDVYGTTKYLSDAKIDGIISGVTMVVGLLLLIIPLQVLNRFTSHEIRLNLICGLVGFFMIVMVGVMPARPWETLVATAGYAAVMMVFLQISN